MFITVQYLYNIIILINVISGSEPGARFTKFGKVIFFVTLFYENK